MTFRKYGERIDRVEARITEKLQERLAHAQTANEMFRVFSKFNALFFRPKIKCRLFLSLDPGDWVGWGEG